jgi:alkylation response protein AidB-like acyl-CoA dehydrogenase
VTRPPGLQVQRGAEVAGEDYARAWARAAGTIVPAWFAAQAPLESSRTVACAGLERWGLPDRAAFRIAPDGTISGEGRALVAAEVELLLALAASDDGGWRLALVPSDAVEIEARSPSPRCRVAGYFLGSAEVVACPTLALAELLARHFLALAAVNCALAQRVLDDLVAFVSTRRMYGQVQLQLQAVRHRVADLVAAQRISHAFVQAGERDGVLAALAATRMLEEVTEGALQLLGGRGYLIDSWIARLHRDLLPAAVLFTPPSALAPSARSPGIPDPEAGFRLFLRDFVARNVTPHAERWRADGRPSRAFFRAAGAAGLIGIAAPRELGGEGRDLSSSAIVVEEFASADARAPVESLMLIANSLVPLLTRFGSEDLRRTLVPKVLRGEAIAALAVTEPGGGSDIVGAIRTSLEQDGDHWILTGEKMFVTNGPIADVLVVLAREPGTTGPLGLTLVAVPASTDGVQAEPPYEKLGLHASPTGPVRFDSCRIPLSHTIGARGYGYVHFCAAIAEERVLIAAAAVATARRCLDRVSAAVGDGDAALEAEVEACRAFVREAAAAEADELVAVSSLAKFAVCERMQEVVRACLRRYRAAFADVPDWLAETALDCRVLSVFAGASEVMRDRFGQEIWRAAVAARNGRDR